MVAQLNTEWHHLYEISVDIVFITIVLLLVSLETLKFFLVILNE